jgi:hypothetical protein
MAAFNAPTGGTWHKVGRVILYRITYTRKALRSPPLSAKEKVFSTTQYVNFISNRKNAI